MQDYWALSADLLVLVTDVDDFSASHPDAEADDPQLLALRHRARELGARLSLLQLE
jgi:hypothetical protein